MLSLKTTLISLAMILLMVSSTVASDGQITSITVLTEENTYTTYRSDDSFSLFEYEMENYSFIITLVDGIGESPFSWRLRGGNGDVHELRVTDQREVHFLGLSGELDYVVEVDFEDPLRGDSWNVTVASQEQDPPQIEVSEEYLTFKPTGVGLQSVGEIEISNVGEGDLVIYSIEIGTDGSGDGSPESFMVEEVPSEYTGQGSVIINVTNMPDEIGEHFAVLTISSNDPFTPDTEVMLYGNGIRERAPEVTSPIANVLHNEDAMAAVIADLNDVFSDPDGAQLQYTVITEPVGSDEHLNLSIDDINQLWIAPIADYNTLEGINVTVRATDAADQYAETSFTIEVLSINDAPSDFNLVGPAGDQKIDLTSTEPPALDFSWEEASQNAYERDAVSYTVHFTTDENDMVSVSERLDATEYNNVSLTQLASDLGVDLQDSPEIIWWVEAQDEGGETSSAVEPFTITFTLPDRDLSVNQELPSNYSILSTYPNPFNSTTTVRYGMPVSGNVKISVYDSNGRMLEVLTQGYHSTGNHSVTWEANNVATGVYFIKMVTPVSQHMQRALLVR